MTEDLCAGAMDVDEPPDIQEFDYLPSRFDGGSEAMGLPETEVDEVMKVEMEETKVEMEEKKVEMDSPKPSKAYASKAYASKLKVMVDAFAVVEALDLATWRNFSGADGGAAASPGATESLSSSRDLLDQGAAVPGPSEHMPDGGAARIIFHLSHLGLSQLAEDGEDGKVNDGKVNDGKVNDGKGNDGKVDEDGQVKRFLAGVQRTVVLVLRKLGPKWEGAEFTGEPLEVSGDSRAMKPGSAWLEHGAGGKVKTLALVLRRVAGLPGCDPDGTASSLATALEHYYLTDGHDALPLSADASVRRARFQRYASLLQQKLRDDVSKETAALALVQGRVRAVQETSVAELKAFIRAAVGAIRAHRREARLALEDALSRISHAQAPWHLSSVSLTRKIAGCSMLPFLLGISTYHTFFLLIKN